MVHFSGLMCVDLHGKRKDVIRLAMYSRFFLFALQVVANLAPDHKADAFSPSPADCTGKVDCTIRLFLDGFHKWDARYFVYIAEHGYTHENTYAFFPLFPNTVRCLASILHFFTDLLSFHTCCLTSAALLNFIFFVGSATALFDLTLVIYGSTKFAFLSSATFCFNPSSIFFSAAYTETFFSFFVFKALLAIAKGKRCEASLWFFPATFTRSNGTVNAGFVVYGFVKDFMRSTPNKRTTCNIVKSVLSTCFYCSLIIFPFFAVNLSAYLYHCADSSHDLSCQNKPIWCCDFPPSIYGHVQKRLWGLGLFSYYQLRKTPNFVIAAPTAILCSYSVYVYLRARSHEINSIGFIDEKTPTRKTQIVPYLYTKNVFCYAAHCVFLMIFSLLFMHVEVMTRLIFSSSPFLYWAVASILHDDFRASDGRITLSFQTWNEISLQSKFCLTYFAMYFIIGTAAHSNFLPWT